MKGPGQIQDSMRQERGLTMIELAIVIAAMGLVIAAVLRFTVYSKNQLIGFENRSELTRYTERISENIRESVKSASFLLMDIEYDDDSGTTQTTDLNYAPLMDASVAASPSAAPPKADFIRMPLARTDDSMTATTPTAQPYYGNEIQFVAAIPPIKVYFDSDDGGTAYRSPSMAPGGAVLEEVQVQRVQFVNIYLAGDPGTRTGALGNSRLALVEWRSIPIVVQKTMTWLEDANPNKRDAIADVLQSLGYTLAWEEGELDYATDAFFNISDGAAVVPPFLPERSWAYLTEFVRVQDYKPEAVGKGRVTYASGGGGVSGFPSTYSIAYNTGGAIPGRSVNTLFAHGRRVEVPRFAQADTDGFPGGFEVLVSGSPNRRKIYAYVTMMAVSAANRGYLEFNASHSLTLAVVNNPL